MVSHPPSPCSRQFSFWWSFALRWWGWYEGRCDMLLLCRDALSLSCFLTFVSQICRAQEPCFTLTLVVSYSHAWQLEAKCHLEQWEVFSPGTAVSAKMCRVKKDENTWGCFGRIALVVVIRFLLEGSNCKGPCTGAVFPHRSNFYLSVFVHV